MEKHWSCFNHHLKRILALRKSSRTAQELVHEVQMAGSRTSVLELVLELVLRVLEPVQELKFWNLPFVSELRNVQELHFS